MKTNTSIEVSNYLFNSYRASENLLAFVVNGKEYYRFEKGDLLSVVGIIKPLDEKTPLVLLSINKSFDFEELLITELPDYADVSSIVELTDTTALAGSQHATSKTNH
jgi:hypothetical protein